MTAKSIRQPPELPLSLLLDAAALLHPQRRPAFLDTAAEQLMHKQSLDPDIVRQTVHEFLRHIDLWGPRDG